MANAVIDINEYRANHGPQLTEGMAAQAGQTQTVASTDWFSPLSVAKQIPTWGWVAAGLVAVGILAARWKQK